MDNTTVAVWFFIAGSYVMVLFVGFAVGFFIQIWNKKKLMREILNNYRKHLSKDDVIKLLKT